MMISHGCATHQCFSAVVCGGIDNSKCEALPSAMQQ